MAGSKPGVVRAPTTANTSFNCPHCGALAKQFWHSVKAFPMGDDNHPKWLSEEDFEDLTKGIEDKEVRDSQRQFFRRLSSKSPFIHGKRNSEYVRPTANVFFSQCYNCDEIAVWLGESLVWPSRGSVEMPSPDMPADAAADYQEASQILEHSSRGAAALLRLAIQKIAISLGGDGKSLNDDIAALVEEGLDKRVQMSLDIVRVVGNNAVHPGEIDVRDDRSTAEQLFTLTNLIVDIMISQPKHVESIFEGLPKGALDAIKRRDKKT